MRGGGSWDLQEAGADLPGSQMVEVEVLWVGREAPERSVQNRSTSPWDVGNLSVFLLQKVFKAGSVPGRVEF